MQVCSLKIRRYGPELNKNKLRSKIITPELITLGKPFYSTTIFATPEYVSSLYNSNT
jgi:hypothetical protein